MTNKPEIEDFMVHQIIALVRATSEMSVPSELVAAMEAYLYRKLAAAFAVKADMAEAFNGLAHDAADEANRKSA